jgi:hypothetical protein
MNSPIPDLTDAQLEDVFHRIQSTTTYGGSKVPEAWVVKQPMMKNVE